MGFIVFFDDFQQALIYKLVYSFPNDFIIVEFSFFSIPRSWKLNRLFYTGRSSCYLKKFLESCYCSNRNVFR